MAIAGGRFVLLPNGLAVAEKVEAGEFFARQVVPASRRDRLARYAASAQALRRILCRSAEPPELVRGKLTQLAAAVSGEVADAYRIFRDSLWVWTPSYFVKIPMSLKAQEYMELSQQNCHRLRLDASVPHWVLVPDHLRTAEGHLLERSALADAGQARRWLSSSPARLDREVALMMSTLPEGGGFEHGDFHLGNLVGRGSALSAIDLGMARPSGVPYLDAIHFSVHILRFAGVMSIRTSLETLFGNPSALFNAIDELQLPQVARIGRERWDHNLLPLYLERRLEWQRSNRSEVEAARFEAMWSRIHRGVGGTVG